MTRAAVEQAQPDGDEGVVSPAGRSARLKTSVALLAVVSLLPLAAGYAREAMAAFSLGTTASADAFAVALLYVDGISAVAAVGIASYALVPVFASMLTRGRSAATFQLVETVGLWVVAAMAPVVVVASFQPAWVVHLLAPGFTPEQALLLSQLVPASAWSATFILLGAIAAGNLQARTDYSWPVIGRAILAFCVAAGLWTNSSHSLRGAAFGLVIGSGLQLVLQLWRLAKAGWVPAWPRWSHPDLAVTLNLALPALAATLLTNVFMGGAQSWIGSGLSEGSLSSVNYAQRTLNLVSTLTMAIATVSLTEISLALRPGDDVESGGVRLLGDCLETGVFLLAPFVALMLVWAEPLLHLLFMRGSYDAVSLERTVSCLRWYALAIVPGFFNTILLRTQPALGRPWVLLRIATVWAVSTVGATALLLHLLSAAAIPAGFLAGQVAACIYGALALRSVVGGGVLSRVARYLLRTAALALLATCMAVGVQRLLVQHLWAGGQAWTLTVAVVAVLLMFGVYLALCGWSRDPHLRQFVGAARERLASRAVLRAAAELDRP